MIAWMFMNARNLLPESRLEWMPWNLGRAAQQHNRQDQSLLFSKENAIHRKVFGSPMTWDLMQAI
jgi:hypothetical protein